MPRNRLNLCAAVLSGIIALAAMSPHAGAEALYRENFGAPGGINQFSAFNWSAYYGNATTNATVLASGNTGDPANGMVSGGPGAPTPGPNINAGTNPGPDSNGFVPLLTKNGLYDIFVFTNEYSIDRTTSDPTAFSWYAGSYYALDTQRLAIQIGGAWYASNTSFTPVAFGPGSGGQGFAPGAEQVVTAFSTDASAWRALNFTPGSPLTLGLTLSSPLPSGPITSFGVYAEIGDNPTSTDERTFFDTFEVKPVPEPAATSVLALGLSTALFTRRRSRE